MGRYPWQYPSYSLSLSPSLLSPSLLSLLL
jgi:hypothetical protein